MKLRYTESSSQKSINKAIDYIQDLSNSASDLRPFYKEITPDIKKQIKHEFDISNPNRWRKISDGWKQQKISEGKPENIGIYTGALLRASSDDAIINYYANKMTWQIADVYSIGFTDKRKIGITTREWLRGLGKVVVRTIMSKIKVTK